MFKEMLKVLGESLRVEKYASQNGLLQRIDPRVKLIGFLCDCHCSANAKYPTIRDYTRHVDAFRHRIPYLFTGIFRTSCYGDDVFCLHRSPPPVYHTGNTVCVVFCRAMDYWDNV